VVPDLPKYTPEPMYRNYLIIVSRGGELPYQFPFQGWPFRGISHRNITNQDFLFCFPPPPDYRVIANKEIVLCFSGGWPPIAFFQNLWYVLQNPGLLIIAVDTVHWDGNTVMNKKQQHLLLAATGIGAFHPPNRSAGGSVARGIKFPSFLGLRARHIYCK
jgi:hypothetical protein